MVKDQALAGRVLDSLDTLQEAAIFLLEQAENKRDSVFEEISAQIRQMLEAILPHADSFHDEDPNILLTVTCKCMLASLKRIVLLYRRDLRRCCSKIQFELLALAEEAYQKFFYWGCVYPDESRIRTYIEKENRLLNINRYTEEGERTGKYKYKVSIAILAYNHLDVTKLCVDSVLRNLPEKYSYELILVNHGSTDGTKEYFESVDPDKQIDIEINSMSWGLGGVIRRVVEGEYYILISNDVVVTPHAIDNLVACMDSDSDIVWAVPATPNISNFQSLPAQYGSIDELNSFCRVNNQMDPYRWEQRVRLCNPIQIERCSAFYSSAGKGRQEFYKAFNVDPWGPGFCYDQIFLQRVVGEEHGHVEVLGINCGLGSNSLKIKEYCHNTDCTLTNITDTLRFLADLKGVSDEATIISSIKHFKSSLYQKSFQYIVWEEPFLKQYKYRTLLDLCSDHLSPGGKLLVKLTEQSRSTVTKVFPQYREIGNDWVILEKDGAS